MTKSISFGNVKPKPVSDEADQWVKTRGGQAPAESELGNVTALKTTPEAQVKEKMARFTIDVSETLHRRIKVACASKGLRMADVLREILEREFPAAKS